MRRKMIPIFAIGYQNKCWVDNATDTTDTQYFEENDLYIILGV